MKRRDFLKTSAMASAAASVNLLLQQPAHAQSAKSKVVIANDSKCYSGTAAVAARVQDMVDHCIMELTGKTAKGAAYEALFPQPVTSSTKIVIKYNSNFSITNSPSYAKVYEALRSGLTSMLNGTFPAANIIAGGRSDLAASSNPSFSLGNTTFRIQDFIMKCDYFINLAACWAMGTQYPCGMTMSQKNMMGAISPFSSLAVFHNLFTNTTTPALAILNSQAAFKQKQVLTLIDAIAIRTDSGPGGSPNKTAYSLIASKDMVAADYQGLLILKANGLSTDRETMARAVGTLSAGAPYNIGNADPNLVDVVKISPPWDSSMTLEGSRAIETLGVTARTGNRNGRPYVGFSLTGPCAGPTKLSIFNAQGSRLWSASTLEWNGETAGGGRVSRGQYFFSLKANNRTVRGRIGY